MQKEELNRIIEKLESSNSKNEAYLAIHQYGGGPDECYAKSNKEGLELLAAQLLKASRDIDECLNDPNKNIIPLDYEEDWLDGDVFIQYVQPTEKKGLKAKEELYKESFFKKAIPFGCIGSLILILIAASIGAYSIFKWFFN